MKIGKQTLNKKTNHVKTVPQVRPTKFASYRDSLQNGVSCKCIQLSPLFFAWEYIWARQFDLLGLNSAGFGLAGFGSVGLGLTGLGLVGLGLAGLGSAGLGSPCLGFEF